MRFDVLVARDLGHHAVGIELNPAYIALAADRLRQEVLWTQVPAERAAAPMEPPAPQGALPFGEEGR